MNIIDANIALRYLLNDNKEQADNAAELFENKIIFIPTEVVAEIVYVLQKVYKVEKGEICESLSALFSYQNVQVSDDKVIGEALRVYDERKLDFVDSLLYAYHTA